MAAPRVAMRNIKECLRLKFEAGLSHEKIARALQLSKGVVSKYIAAARVAGLDWPALVAMDEAALAAALFAPTSTNKPRGGRCHPRPPGAQRLPADDERRVAAPKKSRGTSRIVTDAITIQNPRNRGGSTGHVLAKRSVTFTEIRIRLYNRNDLVAGHPAVQFAHKPALQHVPDLPGYLQMRNPVVAGDG